MTECSSNHRKLQNTNPLNFNNINIRKRRSTSSTPKAHLRLRAQARAHITRAQSEEPSRRPGTTRPSFPGSTSRTVPATTTRSVRARGSRWDRDTTGLTRPPTTSRTNGRRRCKSDRGHRDVTGRPAQDTTDRMNPGPAMTARTTCRLRRTIAPWSPATTGRCLRGTTRPSTTSPRPSRSRSFTARSRAPSSIEICWMRTKWEKTINKNKTIFRIWSF